MPPPRRLALVGAGRAACTLARALLDHGYTVSALTARRPDSAGMAAEFLGGAPIASSNAEAAARGDVVILGVPDTAIAGVTAELAAAPGDLAGRVVLHLAGALDAEVLAALRRRGAAVGSLHPLQTFPERIDEKAYLHGIACAIEGDEKAVAAAEEMASLVGAHPLRLPPGTKALYHAAASVASNHLTTLLDLALRLLVRTGASDRDQAFAALLPLVVSTLSAIEARGAEWALTGPIARGDAATVERHLTALAGGPGGDAALYRALGRATLDLAGRAARLDAAAALGVEAALAERPARVVVSLRARDSAGLAERVPAALGSGDLVEHRLDLLDEPLLADVERLSSAAAIVTCRPGPKVSAGDARRLLARALGEGAAYADVEIGQEADLPRDRLVLSWHGPREGAEAAAERIATVGAAVGKVVFAATAPSDLLLVADLARRLRRGCREVAVLASGEAGTSTRVLARRLGSDWTYACLVAEESTAPGQIPVRLLLERYRLRSVTPGSRVFGLAGLPIGHSLSPVFHNALLPEAIPGAVYVPFPTSDARAAIELARGLPLDGLSVTMPLKEAMATLCDELSPEAQATRSVNTVLRRGRVLRGENTDPAGIAAVAAALLPLAGTRVLILGAGGSARSAGYALLGRAARVTFVSRHPERARAAAKLVGASAAERAAEVDWELLVNATPVGATPVGMAPGVEATPLPPEELGDGRGRAVLDLIYDPRETRLVREAAARGFRVAPGLDVLLAQGREQIRLFTGRDLPLHRLWSAVA